MSAAQYYRAALRTLARSTRPTRPSLARTFHVSATRSETFLNANPQTFREAVANKDKVVLVDFYADWCGPCKQLSPVLEKLAEPSSGTKTGSGKDIDLVTIDTDRELELAQTFKVRAIPTVIAFKDGEPVSQFRGAMPEANVRLFLQSL